MGSMAWSGDRQDAKPHRLRRALCVLICDRPMPAVLRDISGAGAWLETSARPPQGSRVTLRHPDAGLIEAEVMAHDPIGLRLAFDRDEKAVAFALAAIAADMSWPGA